MAKKKAQPSVPKYREALVAVEPQLNDGDRRVLAAHAGAVGHVLSVEKLAAAAGTGTLNWTYGEYGRVGHALADALGMTRRDVGGIWTRAIGEDSRDSATDAVRWKMHRNLAAAVKKMPWGRKLTTAIARSVRKEHVLAALTDLDRGVEHRFHESTKFDVVHHGRRYPPKAVYGLAVRHASGVELGPDDFSAGTQATCFRTLRRLEFQIWPKEEEEDDTESRAADAAEGVIEQRTDIGPVEKQQLVKARRGQGVYRSNLEKIEKSCRVTGIADGEHLRASHIKPWAKSSDKEKLDGYNGLLLAPHVDHLFDRGFISFSDDGRMLVSPKLERKVLERWGIEPDKNYGTFKTQQKVYLQDHRKRHDFEEAGT